MLSSELVHENCFGIDGRRPFTEEHLAKVVELRFFSGLDVVEAAEVLGNSESTIKRDWQMAKAWLHRELTR